MMQSLLLVEGARVELRSILRPPAGSFVRFKPHDDTFLDLAARQVLYREEFQGKGGNIRYLLFSGLSKLYR